MKIKKVTINQDSPTLSVRYKNYESFAEDLYYPQPANRVAIHLIEIETKENPSDLIFIMQTKDNKKILPICLYKTQFVLLKDRFCWDTNNNSDFVFDTTDFKITAEGELKEFSIEFYYSTDQKIPYILLDKNNPYHRFS